MKVRYLVWDAGGTLFDTYPAVVEAAHGVLQRHGIEASRAWLLEIFREATSHALDTMAARYELARAPLEDAYRAAYAEMDAELQPPFPYVRRVCDCVRERGGENFIVTHRDRPSLDRLLHAHDMTAYFTDIITKEDPYPRKPDPTSLEALAARHSLPPAACMVIGDRELDIQAGQRAGMRTCFFSHAPAPSDARTLTADLEITSYKELFQWLQCASGSREAQAAEITP